MNNTTTTTTTETREFGIPFEGFYESVHDVLIVSAAEQMFADNQGNPNVGLVDYLLNACDWRTVHAKYAAAYAEALIREVGLSGKFNSIESPHFYNFETDKLTVDVALDDVKRMFDEVLITSLDHVARQRHTTRSGFISFYHPDWRTWGPVESWDHNQLQTLLEAYIFDISYDDALDEELIMEPSQCNGDILRWIEFATPLSTLDRLYTASDYLNARAAR